MFMNVNNQCNVIYKEYIFEALMILLKDNPFDKIRITDIAKKAGVSRMTYYRYYKNKEDIIRVHIDDIRCSINDYVARYQNFTPEDLLNYYFTIMSHEKCFVNNLVSCGLIGIFKSDIFDLTTFLIECIMNKDAGSNKHKLYSSFIAGGIIALNVMVSCSENDYSIDELVNATITMINNEKIYI